MSDEHSSRENRYREVWGWTGRVVTNGLKRRPNQLAFHRKRVRGAIRATQRIWRSLPSCLNALPSPSLCRRSAVNDGYFRVKHRIGVDVAPALLHRDTRVSRSRTSKCSSAAANRRLVHHCLPNRSQVIAAPGRGSASKSVQVTPECRIPANLGELSRSLGANSGLYFR